MSLRLVKDVKGVLWHNMFGTSQFSIEESHLLSTEKAPAPREIPLWWPQAGGGSDFNMFETCSDEFMEHLEHLYRLQSWGCWGVGNGWHLIAASIMGKQTPQWNQPPGVVELLLKERRRGRRGGTWRLELMELSPLGHPTTKRGFLK